MGQCTSIVLLKSFCLVWQELKSHRKRTVYIAEHENIIILLRNEQRTLSGSPMRRKLVHGDDIFDIKTVANGGKLFLIYRTFVVRTLHTTDTIFT